MNKPIMTDIEGIEWLAGRGDRWIDSCDPHEARATFNAMRDRRDAERAESAVADRFSRDPADGY